MRDADSMAGTFVVLASQHRKNRGIVEVRCEECEEGRGKEKRTWKVRR